jgi:hypothetical protein
VGKSITNPYKFAFQSRLDRLPELNTIDKEVKEIHKDLEFLDVDSLEKGIDKVRLSMPSPLF